MQQAVPRDRGSESHREQATSCGCFSASLLFSVVGGEVWVAQALEAGLYSAYCTGLNPPHDIGNQSFRLRTPRAVIGFLGASELVELQRPRAHGRQVLEIDPRDGMHDSTSDTRICSLQG